mmetsp:Transcript_38154/g.88797  ORF Transcript_38154/g.88797 Transcript_38154/m.88797 type:complete len:268 (+) Transcript_38154:1254-2057(+)
MMRPSDPSFDFAHSATLIGTRLFRQSSTQDRIGLLSLIAIGTTNLALAGNIRSFPKEKAVIIDEISSSLYSTFPYFVAKALSELPIIAGLSSIFGAILYPLVGLQPNKFLTFLGLGVLHSLASQSVGLLLGAASPSSDVALALLPPTIVLNIIFDGKNIAYENTPWPLRWIPKMGLIRWGFEGLALNEFDGLTFDAAGPHRGPAVRTGAQALERLGFDPGATVRRAAVSQGKIAAACWTLSFFILSATQQKFATMKKSDHGKKKKKE